MKKVIKIFLALLLFIPVIIFGQTYSEGVNVANRYANSLPNFYRYLIQENNIKYEYTKNGLINNSSFVNGGFLSKTEFDITNQSKTNFSYLAPGIQYWTLTTSSGNSKYCIDYQLFEADANKNIGVRVTEYVIPQVYVSGSGSYNDPYEFVDIYKVIVGCDKTKGTIDPSGTQYISSTSTAIIEAKSTFGYKYDGYFCSTNKSQYVVDSNPRENNGILVFSAIKADLSCTAKFESRTFDYTLTTDGTLATKSKVNGVDVEKISLVYKKGWYSGGNNFTKLSSTPTRTGYTFKGYYYNTGVEQKEIIDYVGNVKPGNETLVKEDTTNFNLKADWTANQYEVVFSGNGSTSGTMNSITETYGVDFNLPKNEYVRPGYEFLGWSIISTGNIEYTNKQSVRNLTSSGSITLYAVWKSLTFDVTFDNQGATKAGTTKIQTTYAFDMPIITAPGKTGYIFGGYYTQVNGAGKQYYLIDGKPIGKSDLLNNITLYAKWTKCSAGTYAVEESTSCTSCPAGKYSAAGAGSCTNCPAGTYNPSTGASRCSDCAKGYYSTGSAVYCTSCPSCKTTEGTGSTSSAYCDWNYGTGAPNTVLEGYKNHLQVNCNTSALLSSGSDWYTNVTGQQQSYNYKTEDWGTYGHGYCSSNPLGTYGFKRYWMSIVDIDINSMPTYSNTSIYQPYQYCRYGPIYGKTTTDYKRIFSGTNNYSIPTVSGEKTVFLLIRGGGGTRETTISGLKFIVNNGYYTLSQMVANKYIKPLVIIDGMYATNTLGMYYGGSSFGSFSEWAFMFMTNPGYNITGFQLNSDKDFAYGKNLDDGYYFRSTDINNWRMTYK